MEITWLGRNCFRIKGRDGAVLTDPCPPESGYRFPKQQAEIVTSSTADPGYSYGDAAAGEPRVLDAPGEYEVGGILVTGIAAKRSDGSRNVIFVCELDGIRVGHLGLIGEAPAAAVLDELKHVDILLMPVGGGNALSARLAADVMTTIDPAIVIPMNYKTEAEQLELDPLDKFLSESGSRPEPEQKLTVNRSTMPQVLTLKVLLPRG
jgi:L-ascorbate metabolism protein UlaG (beta-lactamase superfamily)